VTCTIVGSDIDPYDTLTYSQQTASSFASLSGTTYTFSPVYADIGSYTIQTRVTDDNANEGTNGVLYTEQSFSFDVIP